MMHRRQAIQALSGVALAAWALDISGVVAKSTAKSLRLSSSELRRRIASIEAANGGRLGVALLDTGNGARFAYRGDERFPMCSTFKFLLASAILARVDRGQESLDRRIAYTSADLVAHSPVTKDYAGGTGMTVSDLCHATMTTSDNTAANLLLSAMGGTGAFNAFLRAIGDRHTRLDRTEPTLNEALPGDPRDTTTPLAMLADLDRLLIGNRLNPASRSALTGWLVANKTGDTRLRAGLPRDWRVGDKTGAGARGTVNDIGIIWPTGRAPILVTSYLTGGTDSYETNCAVHADVARAIAAVINSSG